MIVLKEIIYREIVNDIKSYDGLSRHCKEFLVNKYPDISVYTIGSILSTQWQIRMKHFYRKQPHMDAIYYKMYQKSKESGDTPGILLRLSIQLKMAPGLLAMSILKHHYKGDKTIQIKRELKDTSLIKDQALSYEIYLCTIFDNEYGHIGNVIKQTIGNEYEHRLELYLKKYNISYIDENALRSKGYDKTPDFKLIVPIAVDGFVINWIESKALFGDDVTHTGYLKDQLLCYWNRFGPGLVIYWFGYIDTIESSAENNSMIILRHSFPKLESITLMNPSLIDD